MRKFFSVLILYMSITTGFVGCKKDDSGDKLRQIKNNLLGEWFAVSRKIYLVENGEKVLHQTYFIDGGFEFFGNGDFRHFFDDENIYEGDFDVLEDGKLLKIHLKSGDNKGDTYSYKILTADKENLILQFGNEEKGDDIIGTLNFVRNKNK
ncbi:hypothetical protein Pedsa_0249 [Pseudopedobacter saltans DSM 12145]|uniref:Lipocalin-like domain-containing protein n=1 Tax=Pseudopedobacter saltans (strain ATCC 51119 / DSM 12145 / JCM 21818 / CCUG 39354 / LMG 10337 / NBRC 100064 / NCIMB 13643) TaxID=762903 RepID=F0SEH0_PSESL|nr:hypothetical protein [Pseudopedobacter saltans]ADY50835.1 hypothetical protein Pedsa_0249 [Pseudopedobacter saltans DSM 12145]